MYDIFITLNYCKKHLQISKFLSVCKFDTHQHLHKIQTFCKDNKKAQLTPRLARDSATTWRIRLK